MDTPASDLSLDDKLLINDTLGYEHYTFGLDQSAAIKKAQMQWDRRIVYSTGYFFFSLILLAFFFPFLFQHATEETRPTNVTFSQIVYWGAAGVLVLSSLWGLLWVFPRLKRRKGEDFTERLQRIIGGLSTRRPWMRTLFYFYAAIRPFRFRNIWWWSFVFAVVWTNLEYLEQGRAFTGNPSDFHRDAFLGYALSLTKALLISVLAYIASNVIRELLSLRDKYADTHDQMQLLSNTISTSENHLRRVLEGQDLANVWGSIKDVLVQSSLGILGNSLDRYRLSIVKQMEAFRSMIAGTNEVIHFWFISALASFTEITTNNFQKDRTVITNFKLFAYFVRETITNLLNNPDNHPEPAFEIYSVIIFSPERYLNFLERPDLVQPDLEIRKEVPRYSDPDWTKYLNVNKKAAEKGIIQNRHFLSIRANETIFSELRDRFDAPELLSLKCETVMDELNYECILDKRSGLPVLSDPDQETGLQRYVCSKYMREFKEYLRRYHDDNHETITIRNLLDQTLHLPGRCRVIEVSIDENNIESLNDFFDPITKKPIDYYAIGARSSNLGAGRWLMSFKGPYDQTFDIIKLQFLSAEDSGAGELWRKEAEQLERIFSKERNTIIGVQEYGKADQNQN